MFFPSCPRCGGKSESIEPEGVDMNIRTAGQRLHMASMQGHAHPLLKAVQVVMLIGRQIYKRVPGGGQKRCTNPGCGHTFH